MVLTRVRNVHARTVDVSASVLHKWVSTLGTENDVLWPADQWFPMRLDRPVAAGARGGHGPVRYRCSEHSPQRTEFAFESVLGSHRWDGTHTFWIDDRGSCSRLSHELVVTLPLRDWFSWVVLVGPLHDAVLEDLLYLAQSRSGMSTEAPRWSLWVRLLRRVFPGVRSRSSSHAEKPCPRQGNF